MSEWPKRMHAWSRPSELPKEVADGLPGTEVIPADLGRELYEALKEAVDDIEGDYGTNAVGEERVLLARYEREVGK